MASYVKPCPHCKTPLELQEEWAGMEMTCPQCSKTFTVSWSIKDMLQESKNFSKYPFGRLFIRFAWIGAILCFVYAIIESCFAVNSFRENKIRLLARIDDSKDILKLQQTVEAEYQNMILLLQKKAVNLQSTKEKQIIGITIPSQYQNRMFAFDLSLDSMDATKQSLAETRKVMEDVKKIKEIFVLAIVQNLKVIRKIALDVSKGTGNEKGKNFKDNINITEQGTTGINLGVEQFVDFYVKEKESEQRENLNLLENEVSKLKSLLDKSDLYDKKSQIQPEFDKLETFLNFIKGNLFSIQFRQTVGGISGYSLKTQKDDTAHSDNMLEGPFDNSSDSIERFALALTKDWTISTTLELLETKLQRRIALQMEFDTEHTILTNKLWREIGSILFKNIVMAFLIMVLADYLRAHFDIADQTRKGMGNR